MTPFNYAVSFLYDQLHVRFVSEQRHRPNDEVSLFHVFTVLSSARPIQLYTHDGLEAWNLTLAELNSAQAVLYEGFLADMHVALTLEMDGKYGDDGLLSLEQCLERALNEIIDSKAYSERFGEEFNTEMVPHDRGLLVTYLLLTAARKWLIENAT